MGLILHWVLTEAWPYLLGLLAALGGVFAAWRHGSKKYDQGIQDERNRNIAEVAEAGAERGKVDGEVNRLPDGGALDELRKHWSRD